MRVLVLGGYGNFGRIISRRLAAIQGVELIVGGRNAARAGVLAQELNCRSLALDSGDPRVSSVLSEHRIECVISTAGPFQQQDYRVPQACIAAGSHYIDIADARRFVCDIVKLHPAALTRDVLVLSGASSVPTLSSAVVNEFLPHFSQLESIDHGICASERLPGRATVEAVLSYCGAPFPQWRGGEWHASYGWQEMRRVSLPAPLQPRWVANCDVPDLELFPRAYPGVLRVQFQAGLGLALTQWGLWSLASLRRTRLLPSLERWAAPLHRSGQMLERYGDGVSGMYVHLRGRDHEQQAIEWRWYLVVANNEGPNIPCLAAVALVRKLLKGQLRQRGAMPAVGVLALSEYLAELGDIPHRVISRSSS